MAPNLPEFYTTESPPRRFNKRSRVPNSTGHPAILQPSQILYQTLSGNLWWYTFPVPSFKNLNPSPKFDYGGLQPPDLHCFATSLSSCSPSAPQQATAFLKPNSQVTTFSNILQKSFDSTSDKDFSESERELALNFERSSTRFNSPQSFFVKSTTPKFWTSTVTALPTAWVQVAY